MNNGATAVAVLTALVLAVAGCTHPPGNPGPTPSTTTTAPATTPTTAAPGTGPSLSQGTPIAGMRADDRTVVITTGPLPPADGPVGCRAADLAPFANERPDGVTVGVSVQVDRWGDVSGCPGAEPRQVTLTLAEPLGGRPLRTNRPIGVWVADGDGALVRCVRPACDPGAADPLPPFTCETRGPGWALDGLGPAHLAVVAERCQDRYGVVDFDFGVGACPAGDRERCAGQLMSRVFTYAEADGWHIVRTYTGAGCGDITVDLPEFPLALCRDLPAVEHAGDWGG